MRTSMVKTFRIENTFAIENSRINISYVQLILHYVRTHAQMVLVQKCWATTFNLQQGHHIIIE